MAVNARIPFLLCYDIADPKRIRRVHRLVSRRALMLQYSVYYGEWTWREARALRDELAEMLDPRADDLRIYPLPRPVDAAMLGRQADRLEGLPGLEIAAGVVR